MYREKLDQLMDETVSKNEFSGVVLIKKNREVLFSRACGYANRSWNVDNTLDTRFRIASISKMFTAVAVLQLIQSGRIDFTTRVVDYLQLGDTKIPKEVTVDHLLTHTSGIADYYDEAEGDEAWLGLWQERPIYGMKSLKDYVPLFTNEEPVAKPGERFKYNGAGYILLGLLIEKASGLDYFDYVRINIFEKLGMKDSDFVSLEDVHKRVAEGYEVIRYGDGSVKQWQKNIYTTTPLPASDGGATSTADDLMVFIQSLKKGEVLNEAMTRKILSPYVLDEEANGVRDYIWKSGYANIFILDQDENIVRAGHTGEEFGVSCRLYYYPDLDIDVVILANQGWCAGQLGWKIHDVILEHLA